MNYEWVMRGPGEEDWPEGDYVCERWSDGGRKRVKIMEGWYTEWVRRVDILYLSPPDSWGKGFGSEDMSFGVDCGRII
jgi:hypothetical protein